MATTYEILLLTHDSARREHWERELGGWASVSSNLEMLHASDAEVPEVIVTDELPITQPLGPTAELVSRGEVAVIGVGTDALGDVVLPHDCSRRELRLACQLSAEIVRLRRQLAKERGTRQALQKMAYRDPLTGLANRRKWDRELMARLQKLSEPNTRAVLGVVLLDLDLFKPLNDQLGHVAGDLALQHMAHKLAANLSDQHLAARLGGDEFGVLVSGLLAADVFEVTDRLRQAVESQPEGASDTSPLTASAGVVVVEPPGAIRPLEALRAADRALRAAKKKGRNQTIQGSLTESE